MNDKRKSILSVVIIVFYLFLSFTSNIPLFHNHLRKELSHHSIDYLEPTIKEDSHCCNEKRCVSCLWQTLVKKTILLIYNVNSIISFNEFCPVLLPTFILISKDRLFAKPRSPPIIN